MPAAHPPAAAQTSNLSLVPTYTQIKACMTRRNGLWLKQVATGDPTLDGVLKLIGFRIQAECHHLVPKFVQNMLHISPTVHNSCPGYLTTMQAHRGVGGLHSFIAAEMAPFNANTPAVDICAGLQRAYTNAGEPELWEVARLWLQKHSIP